LIEADFAAAGKADLRDGPPALVVYFGAVDALYFERGNLGLEVIAQEVKLVAAVFFGGMHGCFGWRQGEDKPSVTGVDVGKAEYVAEEVAICFRILAVDDDVCAKDHASSSPF
jgi:hypothetical protein